MNQLKPSKELNPVVAENTEIISPALDIGKKYVARISNALSSSIAAERRPSLFKGLDPAKIEQLQVSDKAYYINRKGKPVSLSVEEIKLSKYLSSKVFIQDENVRENITMLKTMDVNGDVDIEKTSKGEIPPPVQITISIIEACKEIIGTAKERDIRAMGEYLVSLSKKEQVLPFRIGNEEYKAVRPLIMINEKLYKKFSEVRSTKGRKKEETPKEEESLLIAANVIVSSLFLFEAQNKYCPFFKEKYFLASKKNKTELFHILLSDIESKWRQYYISCSKAEDEYKQSHRDLIKVDKEEYNKGIGLAKRKALTYKCSLATLKNRVTTDYERTRKMQAKFLEDVEKAVASCSEYGIITNQSHISKDKASLILVYNPNFNDTKTEETEAEEVQ